MPDLDKQFCFALTMDVRDWINEGRSEEEIIASLHGLFLNLPSSRAAVTAAIAIHDLAAQAAKDSI